MYLVLEKSILHNKIHIVFYLNRRPTSICCNSADFIGDMELLGGM